MAYLDVITLEEAKVHLGVDDTSRDAEITRMLKTCMSKVENDTNHYFEAANKTYVYLNNCVRVYDYPINTLDADTTATVTNKRLYSIYKDANNESIILNVGYSGNVPDGLKDLVFILLWELFHNSNMTPTKEYMFICSQFKRFII